VPRKVRNEVLNFCPVPVRKSPVAAWRIGEEKKRMKETQPIAMAVTIAIAIAIAITIVVVVTMAAAVAVWES
jgi:hypothetical protein